MHVHPKSDRDKEIKRKSIREKVRELERERWGGAQGRRELKPVLPTDRNDVQFATGITDGGSSRLGYLNPLQLCVRKETEPRRTYLPTAMGRVPHKHTYINLCYLSHTGANISSTVKKRGAQQCPRPVERASRDPIFLIYFRVFLGRWVPCCGIFLFSVFL